ncbi:MAG: HAD hydrolase-like protein, partial [Fibrobacter sp.]|nr:HAD hydrolase-like protein [Fibrobacter sp.]
MFGKKQLFVFDLDGTLFNTLGDLAPAVNYALRHFGLPEHDTEKIRSFIGNGSMKLVERSMGDAALPQNMAQSGIHIADVHRVYTDFYWEHCTENTTPNPHILEFLKGTDARCAVLTNKPLAPTLKIFKKFGIE